MNFVAEHLSFQEIDDVWTFALGDKETSQPDNWIILTFGEEEDQDRSQGLTGLYVESSASIEGYGMISSLTLSGQALLIDFDNDYGSIAVSIPLRHLEMAKTASEACNLANATRPQRLT